MTHDEANALKFPARCWTDRYDDKGSPFPMPVTVTGYRFTGGTVKVLVCKDTKQPMGYQCSIDMIELTKETVEAQITADLKQTVQNLWASIADLHEKIAETIAHPLWKD